MLLVTFLPITPRVRDERRSSSGSSELYKDGFRVLLGSIPEKNLSAGETTDRIQGPTKN